MMMMPHNSTNASLARTLFSSSELLRCALVDSGECRWLNATCCWCWILFICCFIIPLLLTLLSITGRTQTFVIVARSFIGRWTKHIITRSLASLTHQKTFIESQRIIVVVRRCLRRDKILILLLFVLFFSETAWASNLKVCYKVTPIVFTFRSKIASPVTSGRLQISLVDIFVLWSRKIGPYGMLLSIFNFIFPLSTKR